MTFPGRAPICESPMYTSPSAETASAVIVANRAAVAGPLSPAPRIASPPRSSVPATASIRKCWTALLGGPEDPSSVGSAEGSGDSGADREGTDVADPAVRSDDAGVGVAAEGTHPTNTTRAMTVVLSLTVPDYFS